MAENTTLKMRESILDRFMLGRKMVDGWGKMRRFCLIRFKPAHVEHWRLRRRGECIRCGGCCSIMFKCPNLKDGNRCSIYERRYRQCGHFPIDPRDLRYLHRSCGFRFEPEKGASDELPTDTLRD